MGIWNARVLCASSMYENMIGIVCVPLIAIALYILYPHELENVPIIRHTSCISNIYIHNNIFTQPHT